MAINLLQMRHSPSLLFNIMILLGIAPAVCSCAATPLITTSDTTEVLSEAARVVANAKQLPAGYCVDPRLDPRRTIVNSSESAGEQDSKNSEKLTYRVIDAPKLGRLPDRALAVFPTSRVGSDCRHALVFHEPEFVDIRGPKETGVLAIVTFDDRCPICGAGYSMDLRKQGRHWIVEAPGVVVNWIS